MVRSSCRGRTLSALLCGASACVLLALSACSASSTARNLVTDQAALLEAGRSMELAECTVRISGHYCQGGNPERWSDLMWQAAELSMAAGRVTMARAAGVSGSDAEAERYYAGLDSATAALRQQRELLAEELAKALPITGSKVAASLPSR